jgi:diphthine synthase
MSRLLDVEKDIMYGFVSEDSFLIVLSRIGTDEQKIFSGKIKSLLELDYGNGPHAIIFPSRFHFTEEDAILNLTENIDAPTDNTIIIKSVSDHMLNKYEPMIRKEIKQIRESLASRNRTNVQLELLDNAEFYLDDAVQFFRQGKKEIGILSIGYADGLVDSIRQMLEIE